MLFKKGLEHRTAPNLLQRKFDVNVPDTIYSTDISYLLYQGVHYTHPLYVQKLKEFGVTQSMSRKGNCLDNAPIESFFEHLKDDVDIKACRTFEEVKTLVENYIDYYNNERCQWGLNKMTPAQCRCHLLDLS